MASNMKIIGEGTYGCVTKPSLKCDTPQDYTDRVSKLMTKRDAEDELNEIEKIINIPNIDKYILRLPKICSPLGSKQFYDTLKKCKSNSVQRAAKKDAKHFRLLLLDNGGVDLYKFIHKDIYKTLNTNDVNIFLTSILQLFEGVAFFRNNDIIHHDIKLPNIVYNVKNSKIKFIDFGIMINKSEFIQSSTSNTNDMSQSWAYFPEEFSCINKDDYNKLYKCRHYREKPYDIFVKKAANTFDSYCLSFCLKSLFKELTGKFNHIHNDFFQKSGLLMQEYCDSDLFKRNADMNALYSRYKTLLKHYNVYNTSKPTPSSRSMELAEKYSINKVNKKEEQSREDSRPSKSTKSRTSKSQSKLKLKPKTSNPKTKTKRPCPPGKERNPKTGRCITIKQTHNIMDQPCPDGKTRNPKTGRCITIKQKQKKIQKRNIMDKPCPPGKERNPKTHRCVKTQKKR